MGRIVSLVISAVYLVIAGVAGGAEGVLLSAIFLIVPLGCIWFGDAIGDWTGFSRLGGPRISQRSPGSAVRFVGWVLLLTPGVAGIIMGVRD